MESFDLLIVGGGINGTAIARDAAARGQRVLLVEKDDLASHTSSASSKLIHGGLRYLEQREFRLVRESLRERAILLKTAPHIVRPLRFVLPYTKGMRPWWMLRAGLRLYDLFSFRGGLPRSRAVAVGQQDLRSSLQVPDARMALYWDAWVDDARLVVLNAVDAGERGAEIATRTEFLAADRAEDHWVAMLSGGRKVEARAIVNAAGAWVEQVLKKRLQGTGQSRARLVKGSHIIVPRLYAGEHAYILQQPDRRVVFALPYGEYNLIGTTDVAVEDPSEATITKAEIHYLCGAVNRYFTLEAKPADVVSAYSGIRSLYDDGAETAQAITRDYRLELDDRGGAKLLSVFGGKLTTARALAEEALDRLGIEGRKVTDSAPLPGGNILPNFLARLDDLSAWMPGPLVLRLSRSYGTRIQDILGDAKSLRALGRHFGAGLYEAEVRYLIEKEFARSAEDILWRRTKNGLHMSRAEQAALARWTERYGPS